jgi:hypothetical protein
MRRIYLCISRYNSVVPLVGFIRDTYNGKSKLPLVTYVEFTYDDENDRQRDVRKLKRNGCMVSLIEHDIPSLFGGSSKSYLLLMDAKDCQRVFPKLFNDGLNDVKETLKYEFGNCNREIKY